MTNIKDIEVNEELFRRVTKGERYIQFVTNWNHVITIRADGYWIVRGLKHQTEYFPPSWMSEIARIHALITGGK